jgi:hypothetical protein
MINRFIWLSCGFEEKIEKKEQAPKMQERKMKKKRTGLAY